VCDLDSGGGPGEGLASCGYFRGTSIVIQERRAADGLDSYIPVILRVEAIYDPDLDRYFLDLPLNGARSRHSLRAHGYDVLVWVRFLASVRGKSVWQADADDVGAYHRARRRSDAEFRISASTWNRAIASLDKLYRWAEREGLIERTPFTHRQVWRRSHGGVERPSRAATTPMSARPVGPMSASSISPITAPSGRSDCAA
jgi:hypothetical protein